VSLVGAGARVTLGAVLVLLAFAVLYLIRPVLVVLLISILFAQAISPWCCACGASARAAPRPCWLSTW
jgi:predicted PurR-regulated permease PerM